jgi:hypothetical protein
VIRFKIKCSVTAFGRANTRWWPSRAETCSVKETVKSGWLHYRRSTSNNCSCSYCLLQAHQFCLSGIPSFYSCNGCWLHIILFRLSSFILFGCCNHSVSETRSVSIHRWKRGEVPTQLDPLERAILNHWGNDCQLSKKGFTPWRQCVIRWTLQQIWKFCELNMKII